MQIAVLNDIHGNLPALNAVLKELETARPDIILVGGDIISGPMPTQTLERLIGLGNQVRFLSGNADREVVTMFDDQPIYRHFMPEPTEPELEGLRWLASQISRSQRDFLANLPEQIEMEVNGLGNVVFCHATLRNDEELFTRLTPDEQVRALFPLAENKTVVCGHTHSHFERTIDTTHIINAGSVGMPYADKPGAYWLLLGPDGYEFRSTNYDREAAARQILASGYPNARDFVDNYMLKIYPAAVVADHFEQLAQQYWQSNR